ncbi:nuclear transport factor 2 family protein [Neobacillus sp. YIM B06451]|uniref:nuclear transport factor 2 family protein n=1 Tax=Neobacillus sp. YIM B06451 TaxID=3070994 RepID=UPI002931C884|nr:nuclear transport factor 2 family protein [Neobacillus sp. YIM B06451]
MNKESNLSLKEIAVSFLQLVASGKVREAYQSYIAPEFRHHNPYFRGDAESLMIAMEENAVQNPQKILEVKLAVQEEDKVVVYSHVKQKPNDLGAAVVHIFRFEGNHIVELWDVGQPIPEDSPNENGMF